MPSLQSPVSYNRYAFLASIAAVYDDLLLLFFFFEAQSMSKEQETDGPSTQYLDLSGTF